MPDQAQVRRQLMVWWIAWAGFLTSVLLLSVVIKPGAVAPVKDVSELFTQLVAIVPLFLSIVIRWLVLPRFTSLACAFPLFVAGLALAEGAGILGLLLGGPHRDDLAILGVLGVVQFAPLFARRLAEPKPQGFIPNN